jgi:hypothetical protein
VPAVTLSVNGNISHPPGAPGDYTVEADCSGTLVFSSGQTFDIVVAPDGKTVWTFQTNPNTVFQGTAPGLPDGRIVSGATAGDGGSDPRVSPMRPAGIC